MRLTEDAVDLIKSFEGLRLEAYQDQGGVWTIGYGHTDGVQPGDKITKAQAERMFSEEVREFAGAVRHMMTTQWPPHVFGACVSLAYNIGLGAFEESTCLRRLNDGDLVGAADALKWWNKVNGKVIPGLVRRRQAEADMMLSRPFQKKSLIQIILEFIMALFRRKA